MEGTNEKAYSPKEMSTTLGIGDSTLRKWCIALEKQEYGFIRNDQNNRVFVEGDIVVLRHFQKLVKQHNMQLDNAAMLVIDRFGKGAFEVSTGIVPTEKEEEQRDLSRSDNELMQDLLDHVRMQQDYIQRQEAFNKELLARLDQQQKYIEDRMDQRDKTLMESIRQSQEERQALLEIASAREEEKKGFFAKLFGK